MNYERHSKSNGKNSRRELSGSVTPRTRPITGTSNRYPPLSTSRGPFGLDSLGFKTSYLKQTCKPVLLLSCNALLRIDLDDNRLTQPQSGAMVIVLNGYPGAGKLTVLTELNKRLSTEYPELARKTHLIHNHLLIDPVVALYEERNEDHHQLCREIHKRVFQHARKLALQGHVILMTTCLAADNKTDAAYFDELLGMVRNTGVPLYFITTDCALEGLEKRVQNSGRMKSGAKKLTDVGVLRQIVKENSLLKPEAEKVGLQNLFVGSLDVNGTLGDSVAGLMNMIGLSTGDAPSEH